MCIIGSEHTREQHTRESKERQPKQEKQTGSPSYIPHGQFLGTTFWIGYLYIHIYAYTHTQKHKKKCKIKIKSVKFTPYIK